MDLAGEDEGYRLVVGAAGWARPGFPERGVALFGKRQHRHVVGGWGAGGYDGDRDGVDALTNDMQQHARV